MVVAQPYVEQIVAKLKPVCQAAMSRAEYRLDKRPNEPPEQKWLEAAVLQEARDRRCDSCLSVTWTYSRQAVRSANEARGRGDVA